MVQRVTIKHECTPAAVILACGILNFEIAYFFFYLILRAKNLQKTTLYTIFQYPIISYAKFEISSLNFFDSMRGLIKAGATTSKICYRDKNCFMNFEYSLFVK